MGRTIRILHVLHSFSAGGLENGVVNIINESPEHLDHELCFLSKGGEFLKRLRRPVRYHELNKRPGNDVRAIFRLRECFRNRSIDIVHTRNWGGLDGVLAACLTPRPVVIHGEHGREIDDPDGMNRKRNLARRALAFRARKFVAVSQEIYRWLEVSVGIRSSKLAYIPNGVDTQRFHPGRDVAVRRALGIADDEFVVGSVGRLDPVKNYRGLIEAVRQLNKNGLRVRLVIAGEGPERGELDSLLAAAPFSPPPLLLGHRQDSDALYRTFDTFVLNSIAEGMPNAVLEAMASGLQVICTAVGGTVDLVSHDKSGYLIPPNDPRALMDAIRESAARPEVRSRQAGNARTFIVENFSLERMVNRYASLYESVA